MEKPHTPNHSHGATDTTPAFTLLPGAAARRHPRDLAPSARCRRGGHRREVARTRQDSEQRQPRGPPRRSLDRGSRPQPPAGARGSRCLDVPAPLGRSSAGGRRRRARPAPLVPSSFEPRHPLNSECWGAAFVEFNQYMLVFHVIDMII